MKRTGVLHGKLDEVTLKHSVGVVEEVVSLALEVVDELVEGRAQIGLEVIDLLALQRTELLDGREHVDELLETALELAEVVEDEVLVERKVGA